MAIRRCFAAVSGRCVFSSSRLRFFNDDLWLDSLELLEFISWPLALASDDRRDAEAFAERPSDIPVSWRIDRAAGDASFDFAGSMSVF